MKASRLFPFATFASHAVSQMYGFDERSAKDCIEWANIDDASVDTCEKTLRNWSLEPERFHAWNPSVGLDCRPWFSQMSYCILTQEVYENSVNYTTTTLSNEFDTYTVPLASLTTNSAGYTIPVTKTDATTRPYTTIPAIPSPSVWKDMGCYIDLWNDNLDNGGNVSWNLDFRYRPRDDAETVDKCKHKCWDIQYHVAGLKLGNECWCGDKNNATLAENQSECDMSCVGDAHVKCGGTQRMNVWAAEESSTGGTLTTASGGSAASTNAGGATATVSSGARRNAPLFWTQKPVLQTGQSPNLLSLKTFIASITMSAFRA
ncbi:hypothetical protein E8E11_006028 [Didymella keratinophila]|nr:hypothetical protein E8E11_006028 [Didymella keratinophila]